MNEKRERQQNMWLRISYGGEYSRHVYYLCQSIIVFPHRIVSSGKHPIDLAMAASGRTALMNVALPVMVITTLLLLSQLILISKLLRRIKRSVFSEKMAGKVVLITGASSGIGEHVAYQYAKKGARLALAARREDRLQAVADKARVLGSPDVIVIQADITKQEDCKRSVDEAVNHFGQLNHLVNNAGIFQVGFFEDYTQISDNVSRVMDLNFWGSVNTTHFALPHLRKSKGRIVVISSVAGWYPVPKSSFYNASKAALTSFFETLSVEFGSDIGVTIVTPGIIQTEITGDNYLKDLHMMEGTPVLSTEACAKSTVKSACRGDRYLTVPSFMKMIYLLQLVVPGFMNWFNHKRVAAGLSKKSS